MSHCLGRLNALLLGRLARYLLGILDQYARANSPDPKTRDINRVPGSLLHSQSARRYWM